jgi:hypothetical protein
MSGYLGDFTTSNTIYVYFNTFDSNDPSASVTLTGLAVTDIEIYKDGSVTQRSSDAGYTLLDTDGIDFDTTTGIHGFSIDLSDNTDAGFYAAGSEYVVVVSSVTVDAATINFIAGSFSIERAGGVLALAKGATGFAAIDTVVDSILVDTGTDLPASIAGIGTAGGAAVSTDAATSNEGGGITGVTSATTIIGTPTNTYTATSVLDGTYHVMTHATNVVDVVYQFLAGGGTSPVGMEWHGYATNNDVVTFSAWNHVGGSFEDIGTFTGTAATTNAVVNLSLFARHMGTSAAELGKVYIRLDSASTGTVINTDQLIVNYAVTSRSVGYALGAIWIDTTNGVNATESYVHGTADLPTSSLANAITINTALTLNRFQVAPGSSITFAETHTRQLWQGHGWDIALGGQSIDECHFFHAAAVTGIGTAATEMEFHDCEIGTGSFQNANFYNSTFSGTASFTAAGDFHLIDCHSGVPGAGAPTFALGTGAINAEFRRWSGGITITGMSSDDVLTLSGELGTVTLGGADGTVEIRGTYKAIVDNRTGSPTLNLGGAILGADVAAILVDTAEIGAAGAGLTALATAAALATTDAVADAIKVTTDKLDPSASVILTGTASGTPSTTAMVSDIGITVDDQYKGRTIIFDAATSTAALQNQATDITACTASSNTLTFTALTTAASSGDTFVIV